MGKLIENFAVDLAIASLSCTAVRSFSQPVDRLLYLTRFATQKVRLEPQESPQRGIWSLAMKIRKKEGTSVFFKGLTTKLGAIVPTAAASFAGFHFMKQIVFNGKRREVESPKRPLQTFLCGATGGTFSLPFVFPLCVKQMSFDTPNKKMRQIFAKKWKEGGLRNVLRAFPTIFAHTFVYRGLYFGLFDEGKLVIFNDQANIFQKCVLAYNASLCGELVAYPIGQSWRVYLTSYSKKNDGRREYQYNNTFRCVRNHVRKHGASSLYKGASFTLWSAAPPSLVLVLNDILKGFSQKHFKS